MPWGLDATCAQRSPRIQSAGREGVRRPLGIHQESEAKKIAVAGSAHGILQQVLNAREGQNQLFGSGAVDLTSLSRPMARTTFFADLEALGGAGPDRKLGSLYGRRTTGRPTGRYIGCQAREVSTGRLVLQGFIQGDLQLLFLSPAGIWREVSWACRGILALP